MTEPEHADTPAGERRVNGVRIVSGDAKAAETMAQMVAALPDKLCQTIVSVRRDAASRHYMVEMEHGLDCAELTQPIADGLARVLHRLGLRHDRISVGDSTQGREEGQDSALDPLGPRAPNPNS